MGEWQDAGIGEPRPAGSHAWDGKTLRITGAGAGLNINGKDQFHFTHLTREAGDFEVAARLADFSGKGDSAAGIMVRTDNKPDGAMISLFFKAKENTVGWLSRTARRIAASHPADVLQSPSRWPRSRRCG